MAEENAAKGRLLERLLAEFDSEDYTPAAIENPEIASYWGPFAPTLFTDDFAAVFISPAVYLKLRKKPHLYPRYKRLMEHALPSLWRSAWSWEPPKYPPR
jgi:hypothetical protein